MTRKWRGHQQRANSWLDESAVNNSQVSAQILTVFLSSEPSLDWELWTLHYNQTPAKFTPQNQQCWTQITSETRRILKSNIPWSRRHVTRGRVIRTKVMTQVKLAYVFKGNSTSKFAPASGRVTWCNSTDRSREVFVEGVRWPMREGNWKETGNSEVTL